MTDQERLVVARLGEAWNAFLELPAQGRDLGQDDQADFRKAIHDAQRIVMSRQAQRGMK